MKSYTAQWTAKKIAKMLDKGELSLNHNFQRNFIWTKRQASLLIQTMMIDYPVPPLYAAKGPEGTFDIFEGKQRITSIASYLKNEYALIGCPDVELSDGTMLKVSGKKFEALPEELQEKILEATITSFYFEDVDENQIAEMMWRLNNGKPLSGIELTRIRAKSLRAIHDLGLHELFTTTMSAAALNKYHNEDVVLKAYMALYEDKPAFTAAKVRDFAESMEFTDEQIDEMNAAFTRILDAYNILTERESGSAKKIVFRTHLLSIIRVALESVKNEVPAEKFADWCAYFFDENEKVSVDEEYNANTVSAVTRPNVVAARFEAVDASYHKYLEENA